MKFDFWDQTDNPSFLQADRTHPSRRIARALITAAAAMSEQHLRLCEIGPGPGFDYIDWLSNLERRGVISYMGFEASAGMIDRLQEKRPGARLVHGGFEEARRMGPFDIAYTKATLEHQPSFEEALGCLIKTAKLIILTFFKPPGDEEKKEYRTDIGMWNNTYSEADIDRFIESEGGRILDVIHVPFSMGEDNAIYLISGAP